MQPLPLGMIPTGTTRRSTVRRLSRFRRADRWALGMRCQLSPAPDERGDGSALLWASNTLTHRKSREVRFGGASPQIESPAGNSGTSN
jgi:hypothetical protein